MPELWAFGYHHDIAPSRFAEMVQVNCTAVAVLTWLFLKGMIDRRRGRCIVSSVAAFQPVPFNSAYAATKAFDLFCPRESPKKSANWRQRLAPCAQARQAPSFNSAPARPHVPARRNSR